MTQDKYPTLHALGLGPQLEAMERLAAKSEAGKYAGRKITDRTDREHAKHSYEHLCDSADLCFPHHNRDKETGELHLTHSALRSLMAAHCVEFERAKESDR